LNQSDKFIDIVFIFILCENYSNLSVMENMIHYFDILIKSINKNHPNVEGIYILTYKTLYKSKLFEQRLANLTDNRPLMMMEC
jgi:hypothetical protein